MRRSSAIIAAAWLAVSCNAISGVDDYAFDAGTTGAGAAGGTGPGGMAPGGVGAAAGGGMGGDACVAPDKLCDATCVAATDPAYGCNSSACDPCGVGETCCGGCQQTEFDPKSCGGCTGECDQDEYCTGGACACRPGLIVQGNDCIDPLTDPSVCGRDGPCGGATPKCEAGTCVAACSAIATDCSDACVDTESDPLHCGSCAGCDVDKVCAGGSCEEYRAAPGCAQCPCGDCEGDFGICCTLPGTSLTICVKEDADECPG